MINIYFSSTHYRKRIFLRNREWIWNIISHDLSIHIYIYVSSSRNFDKIDYLDRFITFSFYSSGKRIWNLVMHVSADRTRAINLKDPRKDGGKDQEIRDRPSFSPRHGSTMRHFSCCRICFPIFGQHHRSSIFLSIRTIGRKYVGWIS